MSLIQIFAAPDDTMVSGDEEAFFAALEDGAMAAAYDRLLAEQRGRLARYGEPVVLPGDAAWPDGAVSAGLDASEE